MTKKIKLKFKTKENQHDLLTPWNVLVVDDEPDIHRVTELALSDFSFQSQPIRFLNAYSGSEARKILQRHGEDISVTLLDVVMETDDAGLQVVNFMRNNLNNRLTRVILRTGQPGTAPEAEVINNYDINDYKTKAELTQSKLFSTVRTAIKSYRELLTIQHHRLGLERIIASSLFLFRFKSFEAFVSGIPPQLISILNLKDNNQSDPVNTFSYVEPIGKNRSFFSGTGVYGQKGAFSEEMLSPVGKAILKEMKECQAIRCKTIHKENSIMIGIWQNNKLVGITFLEGCLEITSDIIALIEIFSANMSLALENISISEDLQKTTVSKDYADNIIRSIIDALIVTDAEGKIETVNQATLDLLGYKEEELIGKPAGRLFSEDPLLEETCLKRIIKEGSVRNYETTGCAKEGKPVPVILSGSVMKDKDGNILGIVEIAKDITKRKRAEEERRRLEAQLLRAQKMEAIGTLAGGVAHDLNNILGGLIGYPELLLLDLPEDSPLRKPILTIKELGERAAAIVQDLLTQARRGVAVAEVVNLNHIIAEYLKSLEYEKLKSYHTKVHVETNLETNLLNIWGSPVHLSKTVMNLVCNASEAMPDGGTIFISTENRYIDRPIRGYDNVEEGDYVTLRVSDTGVGISSEDIERIFEPFYTKKMMGRSGTGLGMTVVWGTVKDHKGYIDVKSAVGKGTAFILYFPVTGKEAARDKSLVSIEDYMARGESILVVDDVEEQRRIASRMLKRLGYSVASVSSGEEAIDYMKNNSADLLVLDMIMDPGIDGLETYKSILEFNPGQKAIIVSGFSETERVKAVQRLGAGAYVKKPYLLEKIGIAVRDELDK